MKHDSAKAMSEGIGLLRQAIDVLQRGPLEHYLAELMLAHDLLVNGKYAPFKPGQVVRLVKSIDFDKHPGWLTLASELALGSTHVVEDVRVDTVLDDLSVLIRVMGNVTFCTLWISAAYVEKVGDFFGVPQE